MSKDNIKDTERLTKENSMLQKQLSEVRETIDFMKTGNIDALVVEDKKNLIVFTEKTADKVYRILIEKMHEGAITLNEKGIILFCNSSFAKMANMPHEKIIGTKYRDFIADSSKEHFDALFDQGRESYVKEDVYINLDNGRVMPVLMSVNTIWIDNIFVLSVILTDLTIRNKNQEELKRRTIQIEQKNVELENVNMELAIQIKENEKGVTALRNAINELKESHAQFSTIFDFNPIAMLISDFETNTYKNVNQAFLLNFGFTKKEVIGKTGLKLNIINPGLREDIFSTLKKKENIENLEGFVRKKNGEKFWAITSIEVIIINDKKFVLASFQDITKIKKTEDELKLKTIQLEQKNVELQESNRELAIQIGEKEKGKVDLFTANTDVKELEELNNHKESILAILSHDLRSPLTGIIGTAEFLESNFQTMEQSIMKEMLYLLHKSSVEELNMLDYLVEWARIKYASETFSPAKIELVQYIRKVFDILNEVAAVNTVNLHNEIEENEFVFADGKMLLSVLQNIVSNAIKHSYPGDEIIVRAKRKEDKIIIEIKDKGIGMSKEIQEKLFFPQIGSLAKERKENKGAGIGLLLVKGLLERNGGEIWVESKEGQGSSFYFTLPCENSMENWEVAGHTKMIK